MSLMVNCSIYCWTLNITAAEEEYRQIEEIVLDQVSKYACGTEAYKTYDSLILLA